MQILAKQFVYSSKERPDQPTGVLIAFIADHPVDLMLVGFSLCNPKDSFSKRKGTDIAINRGLFHNNTTTFCIKHRREDLKVDRTNYVIIPDTMFLPLQKFLIELKERYPEKQIPSWADKI